MKSKKLIITKLSGALSNSRCGAKIELTAEGERFWTALVGNETMSDEEAEELARLFVCAAAGTPEVLEVLKRLERVLTEILGQMKRS